VTSVEVLAPLLADELRGVNSEFNLDGGMAPAIFITALVEYLAAEGSGSGRRSRAAAQRRRFGAREERDRRDVDPGGASRSGPSARKKRLGGVTRRRVIRIIQIRKNCSGCGART